jgi:hypothetical protein
MSNSRIQREVEELLDRLDKFPPKRPLSARISNAVASPFRSIARGWRNLSLPRISAGHVLLAAIILIVVAYVAGGTDGLWRWIIAGAILLFIGAFVMSLRRNSRPPEKYWRDRPMDLHQRGSHKNDPHNRR